MGNGAAPMKMSRSRPRLRALLRPWLVLMSVVSCGGSEFGSFGRAAPPPSSDAAAPDSTAHDAGGGAPTDADSATATGDAGAASETAAAEDAAIAAAGGVTSAGGASGAGGQLSAGGASGASTGGGTGGVTAECSPGATSCIPCQGAGCTASSWRRCDATGHWTAGTCPLFTMCRAGGVCG